MKKILAGLLGVLLLSAMSFADELIIFTMPGCRPCAQFKKMLEENPEVVRGFEVSTVDIVQTPETAKIFNVSSVPTVVRLDDKTHEIARNVGYMSKKEMEEWLHKHSKN